MDISYMLSESADQTKESIDALIDAHTMNVFPDIEDTGTELYAIEARVTGRFAGGVAFSKQFDTVHVNSLAVDSAYRGKDIGSHLMWQMEEQVVGMGVHTISISTLNYQALNFYKGLGFELIGELVDFPRRGMTKFFLAKRTVHYNV